MEADHGPFETEDQALATSAAAFIRAAFDRRPGVGASVPECLQVLTDACAAAGVVLGAHDLSVLQGIAWRETVDAVVIAALVHRAYEAGKAAPTEGAVTEWALSYTHRPNFSGLPVRRVVQMYPDEAQTREAVDGVRRVAPEGDPKLMRREVGPWVEVPGVG